MEGKVVSKTVIYEFHADGSEIDKLIEAAEAYLKTKEDRKMRNIMSGLKKIRDIGNEPEPFHIYGESEPEEVQFYDTYNARVEEDATFFEGKENVRYLSGKGGQFGIEFWNAWTPTSRPDVILWFNSYCGQAIADFIDHRGTGISDPISEPSLPDNHAKNLILRFYIDNQGNRDEDVNKQMTLKYEILLNKFFITKQNETICLNTYMAHKFRDFVKFHTNK